MGEISLSRASRLVRRLRFTRLLGVLAVLLVAVGGLPWEAPSASAAGPAVLGVTATPVHYLTNAPVTEVGAGLNGDRLAFNVSFSCSVAPCTSTSVKIDPTQLDPLYNHYRLLEYSSWTAPPTGGTIAGSATAGYTVNLGNLAVGASGFFTVVYTFATRGSGFVVERSDVAGSNFPDGTPISIRVTAESQNAVAPVSATSPAVPWRIETPTPGIVSTIPANVYTDRDVSYQLRMGTGCMTFYQSMAKGDARYLCASDYTVTHVLPAGAVFVSATGDASYDAGSRTITWAAPEWTAAGPTAAVGWHTQNNWDGTKPRTITVRFPAADYAPPGQPCDFTRAVSATSTVTATYIGQTPAQARTATEPKAFNVVCVTPFAKAAFESKSSTFDGAQRESASISVQTIPSGVDTKVRYWEALFGNQANVDGVAIVTDNTLDLADAPVHRIEVLTFAGAVQPSAQIVWTATDGTTTTSGTASGSVDAPAGSRFVTAVAQTEALAGPNQTAAGTAITRARVRYHYRVDSDSRPMNCEPTPLLQ